MAKFLTDQEIDELLEVKTNEFMKKKEITFNFNIKELSEVIKVLNTTNNNKEILLNIAKLQALIEELNDFQEIIVSNQFNIRTSDNFSSIIRKLNNYDIFKED